MRQRPRHRCRALSRSLLAALFLITILLATHQPTYGKSYTIPDVGIQATVRPDGAVEFTERRTWAFDGSFSWVEQWIPHGSEIALTDIHIGEPGQSYSENATGEPGTFSVRRDGQGTTIRWYFDALDETRTFLFSYVAERAVLIHDDIAELYWQFIGDDWDVATGRVEVVLDVPPGSGEVLGWGHGPLWGDVSIKEEAPGSRATVTWKVDDLPRFTMLEGRIVFDKDRVPAGTQFTGRTALSSILREEQAWADEANRARMLFRVDLFAAAALIPIGLFLIVWIWLRLMRDPKSDFTGTYVRELPADYSPAELSSLWHRHNPRVGPELSATLLDLARRGHIVLQPTEKSGRVWSRKQKDIKVSRPEPSGSEQRDNLRTHEKDLLAFLFDAVADGADELSLADIPTWARRHRMRFQVFLRNWKAQLELRSEELGFWSTHPGGKWGPLSVRAFLAIAAVMVLIIGALLLLITPRAAYVLLAIAGLTLVICMFSRPRSQSGMNDFVRWQAFRQFLLHFSRLDLAEIPELIRWEEYLVYATVLGVARQVLGQMKRVLPRLPDDQRYPVGTGVFWMVHSRGMVNAQGLNTIETVSNTIDRSFAAAIKTTAASGTSSGAGGGGGFSGGGGGGFGGGGGRAG